MLRQPHALLRRLFLDHLVAVFGLLGFALLTGALAGAVFFSWRITLDRIVESTEAANVALTRVLVNEEWDRLRELLPPPGLDDPAALKARPQNAEIEHIVRRFSAGTDLLKVKIYDLQGLTVYSSDPGQIGQDQSGNAGFINARGGTATSELTFRGQFGAFDGMVHARNLVSSYLPARSGDTIQAVLETYTDRTPSIRSTSRAMVHLAIALVPLLYGVYCGLLYLVWRADKVRREQQVALEALTAENLEARAAAEAANRYKSDFLANMSHEMRTPLTAIIGYAQSTLAHRPTQAEQSANLRTIVSNGEHLLGVINDLLDMAKIEAGKLDIVPVPVKLLSLMLDVRSVAAAHASSKGIAFEVDYDFPLPEEIVTDPIRLKEILLNMTNNAVKFTHEGRVTVRLAYAAAQGELKFVVTDTGIGITAGQLESLFRPFSQADAGTSRRYGGTGLGLHISQRLAGLLGGDITVASTPGAGSTFEVLIRAQAPAQCRWIESAHELHTVCETSTEPAQAPALSGNVLLAEDNADNRNLILLYVEPTGASIATVADGKLAVEQALSNDYDLILMDMQMPVMDGIEATRLLRRTGYEGPIVALTAGAAQEDIARCRDAGCTEFVSKPIDWGRFYATLSAHLPPRAPGAGAPARTQRLPMPAVTQRLQALARQFTASLPARLTDIRAACDRARWNELAVAMHDIKGMGGAFGHPELTAIAAAMEESVRGGDHETVEAQIDTLAELCARAAALPAPAAVGQTSS